MNSISYRHCFFCDTLLEEGNAKLLNCMHVICKKCEQLKTYDTSLRCKCDEITNGELLNISIEPLDNISKTKLCNNDNCNESATKFCVTCIHLYCKPCSKVHLNTNSDHQRNLMKHYPIPKGEHYIKCSNCNVKLVEVCCNKCAVFLCSLCQLNYHSSHKHRELNNVVQDFVSQISIEKVNLKKNNKYLNEQIMVTEKKIEDLETQKIKINEDIDKQFERLRKEIDNRAIQLKNELNDNVADINLKIKEKVDKLKELEKNNRYLINITETLVNNYKITDIIKLSQFTTSTLKRTNNYISNIHNYINEVSTNMQFVYDESVQKSISAIKITGYIIPPNILKSSKLDYNCPPDNLVNNSNNDKNLLNDDNIVLNNEEIPTLCFNNFNIMPVACSCCNKWSEEMSKCNFCERFYHNTCHIPLLETTVNESLYPNWKCTMCNDIFEESKRNTRSIIEDISCDKIEWKLIERILMELYCQNNDSDFFRNCPNKIIYPCYYEKVSNPISLNDIKKRHESNVPYDSIIDFILDVKRIFSNVKLYYHKNDPFYKSSINLETFLNSILTKWIPELHHFM